MAKLPTTITQELIEQDHNGSVTIGKVVSLSDAITRRDFATNMSMLVGMISMGGAYALSLAFPAVSFLAVSTLALGIGLPGGALLAELTPIRKNQRKEAQRIADLKEIQEAQVRKIGKLSPELIGELQRKEVDLLLRRNKKEKIMSIDHNT